MARENCLRYINLSRVASLNGNALLREMGMTFIHIPKTAGTSLELALGLNLDSAIENQAACYGKISSPSLLALGLSSEFLQHLQLAEIERLHPTFVRESWVFSGCT